MSSKIPNNALDVDESDSTHTKRMELETQLEAFGESKIRSNNVTHGDYPCHCVAPSV